MKTRLYIEPDAEAELEETAPDEVEQGKALVARVVAMLSRMCR